LTGPPITDPLRRVRLEAQQSQVQRDLLELAAQVDAGEIDEATAARLADKYTKEGATIAEALAGLGADEPTQRSVLSTRRVVGAALLTVAFVAVVIVAAGAIRPREGGFITGNDTGSSGVNLDDVTNDQLEAVIAANPDNPEIGGMRVALANRYFEERAFPQAIPHYLAGLEGSLTAQRRAQALGRVGWMTFLSGEVDVAELYLQEALATDPDYGEGQFFYGLLLLNGRDEPCQALTYFDTVAGRDDIPDDIRVELDRAATFADESCQEAG
jgi:tetratricopeptide (TPR) repeat protein